MTISRDSPGLFQGVYSYQEAARLIGNVTYQRIKRWADGYTFQHRKSQGSSKPVLQGVRFPGVLSFTELIELLFVREYLGLGVSLQHIRDTSAALALEVGPRPFAKSKLIINGRELIGRTAEGILRRPDIGQVIADFAEDLAKRIEFRHGDAARYKPPGFESHIYLDKEIRSGEPVITQYAIPTRLIFSLWQQEHDLAAVANYHDIDSADVSAAIRYESQWRLAA